MTRFNHVLVLIILIFPMFALAPSFVARPNEVLSNPTEVDIALPAQFVQESLRVAVYVEENTTLPSYATGGSYTNFSANVINLLESAGYTVTALTTQDILDHELMVADFDAFVLPNQLPRESIINFVKDYWLGGGGILSFDGSIGFCFYAGLIDESLEGNFELAPTAVPGYWGYVDSATLKGVIVTERHPVTKAYEVDEEFLVPSGDIVIVNGVDLPSIVGDRMINLVTWNLSSVLPVVAAFENPDRGGKIVQIAGNCSSFESWQSQTAIDAIDWLAPRPKGRILYDLTHNPNYGIDSWDSVFTQNTLTQTSMRNMLVNRSHTFDKLYPPSTLSTQNLEAYDILVIHDPGTNFTAAEVAAVTEWVNEGGSILAIADHTLSINQNMNYLLSNMDIAVNHTATGTNALVPSDVHVTHEGCATMSCLAPGAVGTSGSAFPIWEDALGVPVIGGDQHGNGRVILIADSAIVRDLRITVADNAQALITFVNWLSAATAEVLFYIDNVDIENPYDAPAVDALNDLGIPFYLTYTEAYMNLSLHSQQWSLIILDSAWPGIYPYLDDFSAYLDTGGELIISWHMLNIYQSDPFYSKVGIGFSADYPDEQPFHIWSPGHGIFNYPNNYGALNFTPGYDIGDEGDLMTVYSNATAIAGLTETNQPGNTTIALGFDGHVLWNSYLIDQLTGDVDDSTYADNFELWENEIAFMYYDRPVINHPDDVTYIETETGNEITWTPVADAGASEYVIRINGTSQGVTHWSGGAITINVDGVNASITNYQLTVFDRLGYSTSDLVILNVTEYVDPTTTGTGVPIDPMLLIIIGVGAIVVIVIIIIVMKKK